MSYQMLYSYIKKIHVSAGSGHHHVFSLFSNKTILYDSRGGVLDEKISISGPLLEYSTSTLGVWVNHVIRKSITLYYQKQRQKQKHEGPVLGKPIVVSS
jgi:hypothetical protein